MGACTVRWVFPITLAATSARLNAEPLPDPDSAEVVAQAAPLDIVLVGALGRQTGFEARLRSWFPTTRSVRVRREPRLSAREIVKPTPTEALSIWITLGDDTRARIYSARFDPAVQTLRHSFREVELEGGLDEVGLESLAEVVHSSALALFEGQQLISHDRLLQELSRDGAVNANTTVSEAVTSTIRLVNGSVRFPAAASTSTASNGWVTLGPALTTYRFGDEGWQFEPGGFFAVGRSWTSRAIVAARWPHRFDAGEAQLTLRGISAEARFGWRSGKNGHLRIRPEMGLGLSVLSLAAQAEAPTKPIPDTTVQRWFAVAALAAEWPVGVMTLGIRAELRVPMQRISYEIEGAGAHRVVGTAWLAPGLALELGLPLTLFGVN